MFVDNEVVKEVEGAVVYDKFSLASTMIDVSFKGATCSIHWSTGDEGMYKLQFKVYV